MNQLRFLVLLIVLLMLFPLACSLPGLSSTPATTGQPSAAISSPAANAQLSAGQDIQITSVSVDPGSAVVRVELLVDGQVVWVDANASPQTGEPFIVAQPWTPAAPGPHTLQVRAYNQANVAAESQPVTVEVVAAQAQVIATEPTRPVGALVSAVTATPTAAPPPAAVTPTPAPAQPTPTPTITPTPTATPAPQKFAPTGLQPEGRFKDIWLALGSGDSRLGYPVAPVIVDRDYARQRFEKGLMFWWDNPERPDYIWAIDSPAADLASGKTSNLYPDTWDNDAGEVSCDAAKDGGPIRGFGKVWCDHSELQQRLGKPAEPERGSGGNPPYAEVQFFQGGVMIYSPIGNEAFVLFAQGDWQRLDF